MARAFGDFCLKDYGVISIPEFSHRTLTESDKFIVLASDGVSLWPLNIHSVSHWLVLFASVDDLESRYMLPVSTFSFNG